MIKIQVLLRWYIVFLGVYMVGDALVHIINLKLIDVKPIWDVQSYVYSSFINRLFGCFGLLIALLCFEAQRDIKKYKGMIKLTSIWAFFYSFILIGSSLQFDFGRIYKDTPSIFFWIPFYNFYLIIEAALGLIFCLLVLFWLRKNP